MCCFTLIVGFGLSTTICRLPHPREVVWKAITNPKELVMWLNTNGFAPGMHAFLDRLFAHLNDEMVQDWMRRHIALKEFCYS
jgi:hypothetical protein